MLLVVPRPQIYHELAGLQELRFNWRDKVPPYSLTTSLSGAMQHYPDRDLLLAMYHVPQVCVWGGMGPGVVLQCGVVWSFGVAIHTLS